jgi:PAS domain S-box-containing protein
MKKGIRSPILRHLSKVRHVEGTVESGDELFRQIVETANEGIWLIDTDARTTFINQRMADLLGYRIEELVDRAVHEFVFEQDQSAARERIAHTLAGGQEQLECRFRRKDGTPVHVLGGTSPVRNGRGQVVGALGMFSDLNDRRAMEQRLRESEARFRQLAEALPQMVWTTNPEGRIDYVNAEWCRYTGLRAEQSKEAERVAKITHPEDQSRLHECWKNACATGTAYECEFRMKRASDGAYRWFLTRAVPIKDEQGKVLRWLVTNTDIDDQKRTQELLKAANRRKDEFLAMLSHELRNPLAPIRNALHIMQISPADDASLEEARNVLERQVRLMTVMIDDLLDISRLSRHQIMLRIELVDLRKLVRDMVEDHRKHLEQSGLAVQLEVPDAPVWITGDGTRLSQVLINLLHNAAKFSNFGDSIFVRLVVTGEQPRATVTVRDTGAGIPAEMLPHVFDAFSQVEQNLDRRHGGLGLGLALAKGIVELHGGEVQATSPGPDCGAEFTISLPLDTAAKPAVPNVHRAPSSAKPLRVLIVEDNRDAAKTLGTLLRRYGHDVKLAHSGTSAVATAKQWGPDVVLCDLGLPEMDGYEVASILRQEPALAAARLIAISGYGDDEDRQRSRAAGFELHLIKPVDPAELQRLLVNWKNAQS